MVLGNIVYALAVLLEANELDPEFGSNLIVCPSKWRDEIDKFIDSELKIYYSNTHNWESSNYNIYTIYYI